jgi:hypothetical protein
MDSDMFGKKILCRLYGRVGGNLDNQINGRGRNTALKTFYVLKFRDERRRQKELVF